MARVFYLHWHGAGAPSPEAAPQPLNRSMPERAWRVTVGAAGVLAALGTAVLPGAVRGQEKPTVNLGVEVRLRGEWDGRTSGSSDDAATLSRIRLDVGAGLGEWLRAQLQVQDSRAWGTETSTIDASADQLDLHQGYIELGRPKGLLARLGRQAVALGDERLVSAVDWSNTGRVFDGARLAATFGAVEATAFWMNVAERDALLATGLDPQANEGSDGDGWLLGAFLSRPLSEGALELTALYDRNALTDQSYTLNLRAQGRAGLLVYEAAGAYQFGSNRRAFLLSGRVGVEGDPGSLAAQVDYLSGDGDLADAEQRAFNPLYYTPHKFHGYMDYFAALPSQTQDAGLVDAMVRAAAPLPAPWNARLDLHYFGTPEDRTGRRSIGLEADGVASRALGPWARLELGASVFVPDGGLAGVLLPAFAAATNPTYWAYAQLIVSWRGS